MIKIKVVRIQGQSALIEFLRDGMLCRSYVPATHLAGNELDESVIGMGIEYGEDWAELASLRPMTPEALQLALRNAGIWTKDDFFANPKKVIGVIKALYGLEYAKLATAVKSAQ